MRFTPVNFLRNGVLTHRSWAPNVVKESNFKLLCLNDVEHYLSKNMQAGLTIHDQYLNSFLGIIVFCMLTLSSYLQRAKKNYSVAHFSTDHEQTQYNRIWCFHFFFMYSYFQWIYYLELIYLRCSWCFAIMRPSSDVPCGGRKTSPRTSSKCRLLNFWSFGINEFM